MDELAGRKGSDREAVFRAAANEQRLPPLHVEKDFWVCWLLRRLFDPPLMPGMVFKGGTSLSKAWHAIARFSEDIDITLPRNELPGGLAGEVVRGMTGSRREKRRKRLAEAVSDWCGGTATAELTTRVAAALATETGWSLMANDASIEFVYPKGLPRDAGFATYVKPAVVVEFGASMPTEPSEIHSIRPYASRAGRYEMQAPDTDVNILAPVRTFWEKATLVHAENSRPGGSVRDRISRHYADLATLAIHDIGKGAVLRLDVLADVAEQKERYFPLKHVDYGAAGKGALLLAPPADHIGALRHDYEQMREMYFEEPVVFDEVVARLKNLEADVRARSGIRSHAVGARNG